MNSRKLWTWLGIIFVASFAVLLYRGREIYLAAAPQANVKSEIGDTLYTADQVREGQRAWLAAGGQQLGTVWGRGSSVAPDWSADWLHREAVELREMRATSMYSRAYDSLAPPQRASVDSLVRAEMRHNTYDPATNTITVSNERAVAIAEVQRHYMFLFGDAPGYDALREKYAMRTNLLPSAADRKALAAFFFWTSWSASTERPGGQGLSYTGNSPDEPLVGTVLPGAAAMRTVASVILLLAGIAGMIWYRTAHARAPDPRAPETAD